MAEIHELARIVFAQRADRLALPAHLARRRRQQAAQDAQQAGLAAAVVARDAQRLAFLQSERQPAEQLPPAALALEIDRLQHGAVLSQKPAAQPASTALCRRCDSRCALSSRASSPAPSMRADLRRRMNWAPMRTMPGASATTPPSWRTRPLR